MPLERSWPRWRTAPTPGFGALGLDLDLAEIVGFSEVADRPDVGLRDDRRRADLDVIGEYLDSAAIQLEPRGVQRHSGAGGLDEQPVAVPVEIVILQVVDPQRLSQGDVEPRVFT